MLLYLRLHAWNITGLVNWSLNLILVSPTVFIPGNYYIVLHHHMFLHNMQPKFSVYKKKLIILNYMSGRNWLKLYDHVSCNNFSFIADKFEGCKWCDADTFGILIIHVYPKLNLSMKSSLFYFTSFIITLHCQYKLELGPQHWFVTADWEIHV